jgi:hypothetical protein
MKNSARNYDFIAGNRRKHAAMPNPPANEIKCPPIPVELKGRNGEKATFCMRSGWADSVGGEILRQIAICPICWRSVAGEQTTSYSKGFLN